MGSIINAGSGAAGGMGAGIGSLIGGIVGAHNSSGDYQNANEAAQKAAQQLISTGMPPDMAKQIVLQQYKSAGQLTPQLEQAINLGPSAVANIQTDPNSRNAQMSALQQYQQAGQTGQTAQDQLNNLKMQDQINSDAQSRNASIIQGAQQRGEAGSGASLAAQLANAQSASNNESQQGLQLAANANQARMSALGQAASLGGQINSQDFNQANTKANAADQFQRFNVQNQQAVANQNTTAQNQAQAANLANSQQIANANTNQTNTEAQRESQAQMTNWQAQNQRNSIINQGYNQSAGNYNSQGDAVSKQAAGMGAALGGMLGSGLSAATSTAKSSGGGGGSDSAMATGDGTASAGGAGDRLSSGADDLATAFAARGGIVGMLPRYADGGPIQAPPQQIPQQMMQQQPSMPPYQAAQTMVVQPKLMFHGGQVPGHPIVHGDNYRNDVVPIMAAPTEIMIPTSITSKPDAPERAMEFVKGVLASKKHNR